MIFLHFLFNFVTFCMLVKYSSAYDPVKVVDEALGMYGERNVLNLIMDKNRESSDRACPLKNEDFISYNDPHWNRPVRVYKNCRLTAQTFSQRLSCSYGDPCEVDSVTLKNYLKKPKSMDWQTVAQLSAHYLGTEAALYRDILLNNGKVYDPNRIVQENTFSIERKLKFKDELAFFVVIGGLKCDIGVRALPNGYFDRVSKLSSEGFSGTTTNFHIDCEKNKSCIGSCKEYKLNKGNFFLNVDSGDRYWTSSKNKECLVDLDFKNIYAASEEIGPCLDEKMKDPSFFAEKELIIPLFHPNGTVVKAVWSEYHSNSLEA